MVRHHGGGAVVAAAAGAYCAERAARGQASLVEGGAGAVPVEVVSKAGFEGWLGGQPGAVGAWAAALDFTAKDGEVLLLPGAQVGAALVLAGCV